jgi:hypothetical protein
MKIKKQKLNEGDYGEGSMARGQLARTAEQAIMILNMITDDTDLEEWVESKITKSQDYLSSVLNYMKGKAMTENKMKITKSRLKQIIKEELSAINDKDRFPGLKDEVEELAKKQEDVYVGDPRITVGITLPKWLTSGEPSELTRLQDKYDGLDKLEGAELKDALGLGTEESEYEKRMRLMNKLKEELSTINEMRMSEMGKVDAEDGVPPSKIGRGNEEYMEAYNAVLAARGEKPLDVQKPDQAYLDALRSGQLEEEMQGKNCDELTKELMQLSAAIKTMDPADPTVAEMNKKKEELSDYRMLICKSERLNRGFYGKLDEVKKMKLSKKELKKIIKEELENALSEEEEIFAPNHYCVKHGGVNVDGEIKEAKAVGHNWDEELNKVTHYDMQLEDGTILENVSSDDIMITQAVLEGSHGSHPAKKKKKK